MSRTTDVQRGADMALNIAAMAQIQPDLFADAIPGEFWRSIELAALDQLEECDAYRAAVSA